MGRPLGKASGRTFNRMGTYIPDTCWSSLWVTSCHPLAISNPSPSEASESGLPMSVYATPRVIDRQEALNVHLNRSPRRKLYFMRMILIGIIFVAILFVFWSLRASFAVEKRRRGTEGRREPEKIERCIEKLGLKSGASQEEINQAYRDLVTVWHPDRFANNLRLQKKAEENLKEINAAYEYIRSFYSWK